MSLTLAELESVRMQLEKAAPGIQDWEESGKLYGAVADTVPEAALPSFVSSMDVNRPEVPSIMPILAPRLDAHSLNHVVHQASRNDNIKVLDACWNRIQEKVQDQVLHEAGRKQDTDMLEWTLGRRGFSQQALEEALMNSVWQGGRAGTNLILVLVEKPWRIINALRKKGDPPRLLKELDEAWGTAINEARAVVPDGRVLTAKFQADMPEVSHLAQSNRMDKALPHPRASLSGPRGRM